MTIRHATDSFRASLFNDQEFTISFELVPGRGSGGKRLDAILRFAEACKKDGRITALSITDNPGGHPALAPTSLGLDIQAVGLAPLIHVSLKDKNRNMAESQLFECHRHQLLNLLVLGGDYPRYGFHGQAMPVFDLDSPQLLTLIHHLRQPQPLEEEAPGALMPLPAMNFMAGCVVSPFKSTEAEQRLQYVKLLKKICAGADFIVSQLGFDMKKYQELLDFCRANVVRQPVLASVFIPSLKVAEMMHRGQVPGILFSDSLLRTMREEATQPGKGEEARLIRGAKMVAVLHQMGYAGVHLGGNNLSFDKVAFLLDQAEYFRKTADPQELRALVDFPCPQTWYLQSQALCPPTSQQQSSLRFRINQQFHDAIFTPSGFLFRIAKEFCLRVDRNRQARLLFTWCEQVLKIIFFRCRSCGDCTITEANYLCPQSGCPKKMINGPCGGSLHGFCEVYPEQLCFWVRAYQQNPVAHCYNQSYIPLPPKDWSLQGSSSWINYFAGRDHQKKEKETD